MSIKIVTDFGTLLKKAHRLGKAKSIKNPNQKQKAELEEAELAHTIYRDLCLKADEMTV